MVSSQNSKFAPKSNPNAKNSREMIAFLVPLPLLLPFTRHHLLSINSRASIVDALVVLNDPVLDRSPDLLVVARPAVHLAHTVEADLWRWRGGARAG